MRKLLLQLHVENLALIDELDLEFGPSLNVLTGETGAGKSMVVDAVDLVAGGRASAEVVRSGARSAIVEALFDITGEAAVSHLLESLGLEASESLLLSREVSSAGRSICRVNGRLANVGMLRQIGAALVDLHGQHDNQVLLDPREQLKLLDYYAGPEALKLRAESEEMGRQLAQLTSQLKKLCGDEREQRRRMELLRYQVNEIDSAKLRLGEEEELFRQQRILSNAARLQEAVAQARTLLAEGREGPSALDLIEAALSGLTEAKRIDDGLANFSRSLEDIALQLQDLVRDISTYGEKIDSDPERLAMVERRLEMLNDLKRKYGEDIEEILRFRQEAAEELQLLAERDVIVDKLQEQIGKISTELSAKRDELGRIRREAASLLSGAVVDTLRSLGMSSARFDIRVEGDSALFWFSANPGEPLLELSKVASGGELSRIMLAIKAVSVLPESARTLLFDEVDAGIGGVVSHRIGMLLSKLAKQKQVICVTHSPQIAAIAETHYSISKEVLGGRNVIRIRRLEYEERLSELARMMGDGTGSRVTIEHAKELMSNASQLKKSL
ncbi:MAG TPA: DNA repair protein RecN [Firmicutes bacterium]|nr:DNA repair protein RecN [Bacillota bacterium]